MMFCAAHSTPKTTVSFLRLVMAAALTVDTESASQAMHILASLSSKKAAPSCEARRGMCSMMARRTRHWRSSASSMMAGRSDCDRESTPITWLTESSFEIMLSLASWCSSLSSDRKRGTSCSIVWLLPSTGARPMMTEARAARTWCEESTARSRAHGRRCCRVVATDTLSQKSVTLNAAAVRTSGSESFRNLTRAAVISLSTTAFACVSAISQ
mmetsp:Transcript_37828/g.96705  ORF Transcript_37828/g.96705 Transcript_37828/m.96705 type:complete len:213 (+) Transcript_37828:372-1010(+)